MIDTGKHIKINFTSSRKSDTWLSYYIYNLQYKFIIMIIIIIIINSGFVHVQENVWLTWMKNTIPTILRIKNCIIIFIVKLMHLAWYVSFHWFFFKSPPLLQLILERRQRQAQLEFFISLPLKDAKVFYFLVLRERERERERERGTER